MTSLPIVRHPSLAAPAWSAARQRVETYLRAHHIPRAEIPALAQEIVARARAGGRVGVAPVTAAIELAETLLGSRRAHHRVAKSVHPAIRLTHMATKTAPASAHPSLSPRWAGYFQKSLVKVANGLALTLSLIGATWAGNR
ncbi:MAG: hypothetical protein JWM35_2649 [Verrucomicrobia bacterium]|nr:hypothetical protein [Verrucomicrobiota bacterium]